MLADVQRIVGDTSYVPTDPQELAAKLFTTCYMATENSSTDTRSRAAELAKQVGRYCVFTLDSILTLNIWIVMFVQTQMSVYTVCHSASSF